MEAIIINVYKQMDGYTFSLPVSIRQRVKDWFPDAHPANRIFVAYDIKSDFEKYYDQLENYIYPALLGIRSDNNLDDKVKEIQFVDSETGNLLHTHRLAA